MSNFNMLKWVKILMLKGEKGDRPTISTTPIDNGTEVTFSYSDGTSESVDLHNATSGDYSGLTNKPSINSVLLSGNKSSSDLGLCPSIAEAQSTGLNGNTVQANSVGTIGFVMGNISEEKFIAVRSFKLVDGNNNLVPLCVCGVTHYYSTSSSKLYINFHLANNTENDITISQSSFCEMLYYA